MDIYSLKFEPDKLSYQQEVLGLEFADLDTAVELMKKAKGCSNCGYNDNPDILHFHHINPETKINNISRMVGKNHSMERILAEIDKCKLLCITCHHKEHGIKDNYV